ncbi:tRNA1(Val) (adenine(37)-N6)-methyltransferase [Fulvivirga sedimenti]|uniref:tRNA1(Val) (adenine(37)-N6)-methyltransferase n=1 Tax=Fulvivirga sedimenti TaxID=2879465 RepID=A0A9X1HUM8_9BACT|nr:methyltransferase [Fulvivirga sedimenti]MCA6075255.1 methyltransferase [Fulvivirga sedimenti]MCA6076432.1 methyltransferase [Fulvivirga sedimenti]MCA6077560.1 methyltransferase [Fulvivirga sedimenti]
MNDRKSNFRFKEFTVVHNQSAMKVGTDGVLLGAWAAIDQADSILDVGTGTGLIALMAAQRNARAGIHAIEPDEPAYAEARENFQNSPWKERLTIEKAKLQEHIGMYQAILTNPPYFHPGKNNKESSRNQARQMHELSQMDIIEAMPRLLTDAGNLHIILPVKEGKDFMDLALVNGLFLNRHCLVYSDHDQAVRRMMSFGKTPGRIHQEHLFIRNNGEYTEEYKALTSPFYLELKG